MVDQCGTEFDVETDEAQWEKMKTWASLDQGKMVSP